MRRVVEGCERIQCAAVRHHRKRTLPPEQLTITATLLQQQLRFFSLADYRTSASFQNTTLLYNFYLEIPSTDATCRNHGHPPVMPSSSIDVVFWPLLTAMYRYIIFPQPLCSQQCCATAAERRPFLTMFNVAKS